MPNKPILTPQTTKTFRKPYRYDERERILLGAGLPEDVHPYHIDESDAGIIAGGNCTSRVRSAILNAFTFAFEQCTRYKVTDPGRAFNRYPAFRETSLDIFEPLFYLAVTQGIPASDVAQRLEYADRMSRPEIQAYEPITSFRQEHARTGRPPDADREAHGKLSTELHARMPWKDVAAEMESITNKPWNYETVRKVSADWKKRNK